MARARAAAGLAFLPPVLPPPAPGVRPVSADEIIEEAQRRRRETSETGIESDTARRGREIDFKPLREAGEHFLKDVADGWGRWLEKNPARLLSFGVQALTTVVAGVSTGGASLAVDGPKLAAAAAAITTEVLRESGISIDRVAGQLFSGALQSLGVDRANAEKWGDVIGSTAGAALELTLFFSSKGQHPLPSAALGDLAGKLATAFGAERTTAALVASTSTALARVAMTLAGGAGEVKFIASGGALWSASGQLATVIARGLSGGGFDEAGLLASGTEAYSRLQAFLQDFAADAQDTQFWSNAAELFDRLAKEALSSVIGGQDLGELLRA